MTPGLSVHFMVKDPPLDRMAMLVDFLQPIADEFVIVDTGSSNADLDTMTSWKKVVILREFFEDFSTTRNKGLALHQYEWTLGIDPDEMPSVAMYDFIKSAVEGKRSQSALGWLFWTRNFWGGVKGPEEEYHWHCRLWKSEAGRLYKPVHEQVRLNGQEEATTRETAILPKAPRDAFLIHSKAATEIERADALYRQMGEQSR